MSLKPKPVAKEHFSANFAVTESNPDEGTFRGLASVFGSMVDAFVPTVFERGAFTKTLQENAKRFRVLYQHDSYEPLARPGLGLTHFDILRQTDAGLEIGAKISQTTRGKDAIILLRDRVIDELSIGHDPIKADMMPLSKVLEAGLLLEPEKYSTWNHNEPIRVVRESRLWESSLVTWGADSRAMISEAHALDQALEIADLPLARFVQILKGEQQTEPGGTTLNDLAMALLEIHKGAMLNAKNKKLIKDCVGSMQGSVAALQALLAAAEPPAPDSDKDEEQKALTANAERLTKLRGAQLALAKLQLS